MQRPSCLDDVGICHVTKPRPTSSAMGSQLSSGTSPVPLVVDKTVDRSMDLYKQFLDILHAVRPAWRQDGVTEKHFNPGFINLVRCYHQTNDYDLRDGLVIRVYGKTRGTFVNRDREFLAMQLASQSGCFGRVEAVFTNGLVYQYIPGRCPTLQELNDTNVIENVTRALARFHHQSTQSCELRDRTGEPAVFPGECTYFQGVRCWLSRTPETLPDPERDAIYQQHRLSKAELEEELQYLEALWDELDFDMCVSHGDFHKNNMLYNPSTGEVHFVDYEISECRPEGFDLAYLLANTAIYDAHERKLYHGEPWYEISPLSRYLWLRFYLQEIMLCRHGCVIDRPKEVDELFSVQIEILEIIITFATLVNSQGKFIETLPVIKERYFTNKPRLEELKQSYLALKKKISKQPPPLPL